MARTTPKQMDSVAASIDIALSLPEGTHSIQGAYDGWKLVRDGGAVEVSNGYVSPRVLMDWMRAYKSGIFAGRRALMSEITATTQGVLLGRSDAGPIGDFDRYGFRK